MQTTNAIGWFDLYVDDLDRAVTFYETVFQQTLEPIGDPTGETIMRGFPASMQAYGAAGALVKAPHARPGVGHAVHGHRREHVRDQLEGMSR